MRLRWLRVAISMVSTLTSFSLSALANSAAFLSKSGKSRSPYRIRKGGNPSLTCAMGNASLGFEVGFVRGQQGDEVPAGGVATHEDLVGSATVFLNIFVRPGEGASYVLDVLGVHDFGAKSVIGDNRADAV